MSGGIEFDWDEENTQHLAKHNVTRVEFEQVMNDDPVDIDSDVVDGEDRYRSVGLTNKGRLLSALWTIRNGKVRPITAFPAGVSDKKVFLERSR